MISSYLNQDGYRVNNGNWELYDDTSAATLELTGDLPEASFRCRITLSSVTGHADCIGHILINSEDINFLAASSKNSTILLTELPTVTTTGLDCNILITAIDSAGAPIPYDTQLEISCRFQDTQKSFRDSKGEWSTSSAIAYVTETSCGIGTIFSCNGYDYNIAQVSIMTGLDGTEEGRKLWLTGKTESPDRAVEVEEGSELLTRYMTKAVYDTDEDGIADKAEGVRDLDDLPTSPDEGEMAAKDGKLYVAVT